MGSSLESVVRKKNGNLALWRKASHKTPWNRLRWDIFSRNGCHCTSLPCQFGSFRITEHAAYKCGHYVSLWGSRYGIYMKVHGELHLPKSSGSRPRSAFTKRLKRSLKWLLDWEGICPRVSITSFAVHPSLRWRIMGEHDYVSVWNLSIVLIDA